MIASRTAVEEGLYRKETLSAKYPSQSDRNSVINTLWSIFCLDMQFNYAAGLPNLLNEDDVDLPPPVNAPYLSAMVEYVLLGAQAWTTIVKRDMLMNGHLPSQDKMDFFHYQVDRWQQRLHPDVRFDAAKIDSDPNFFIINSENSREVYLKSLCYLRSNQIQILVLRTVLMHPSTAKSSPALAQQAVIIAQKSIRVLNQLAVRSQLYRKRQMIFNHFLGSSLAVLFLAAALDVELGNSGRSAEDTKLLHGDAEELHIGLKLVDDLQSTRLLQSFERPRKQLSRLRVLNMQQGRPNTGSSDKTGQKLQGAPDFLFDFDIGVNGVKSKLDLDNSLFDLDWFDGQWADPSELFGVPSWM